MIKHLKDFFYPPVLAFTYNQPKEIIIDKIKEVLSKKVTFFSSRDMTGMFLTENMFTISLVVSVLAARPLLGFTLVGDIFELRRGVTEIRTKPRPSIGLYLLFFVAIILSIVNFYEFINTGSAGFLFWSLGILFGGACLSIGLSNVGTAAIYERYKMYIDKELIAK